MSEPKATASHLDSTRHAQQNGRPTLNLWVQALDQVFVFFIAF